jgi:hypothetical protein
MNLQITDYRMKDRVAYGERVVKKVIAQEVEKFLPEAVTKSTQIVPDIYKMGEAKNNRIQLHGNHQIKAGDIVRVITKADGRKHELQVAAVGKNEFTVESTESINGQVFVYGTQRDDVRGVDYDAISMLNVSATQELAKRQEATTRELAAVRADRDKLAVQVEAQAAEITSLKKQQAAEIAQIKAALEAMNKLVAAKVTEKATKVASTTVR